MIVTRDVRFNERTIFDRNLDHLIMNQRQVDTEFIAEFLRHSVVEEQSQPELPRVFDNTNEDEI